MSALLLLLAFHLPASAAEAEAAYMGTGDGPSPAPPVTALVGTLDSLDLPGVWKPQVGDLIRAARATFAAPAARGYVASRIGEVLSFDDALAWETFEQIAYTDPATRWWAESSTAWRRWRRPISDGRCRSSFRSFRAFRLSSTTRRSASWRPWSSSAFGEGQAESDASRRLGGQPLRSAGTREGTGSCTARGLGGDDG